MATLTITQNIGGGGQNISKQVARSADLYKSYNFTVADGQTDQEVAGELDVSELKAVYIVSDQNVTLETNSGSTPADTISLVANVPYVWYSSGYHTNLLTTDVTAFFFTNSSGSLATIKMEFLEDPTP